MSDLDEISMMLGQISADLKHALAWQEAHERADQERFNALSERMSVNNGYRFRIETLEDVVEIHKPVIEEVRRLKWMAAALSAGVLTLAGVIGSVASFAKDWIIK